MKNFLNNPPFFEIQVNVYFFPLMDNRSVILHPGKEKAVLQRHHWVFSGAIKQYPPYENGEILQVKSHEGKVLGSGYFNRNCSIAGRMISFDETPPLTALANHLEQAITYRNQLFSDQETTAYRLINGEGDLIPGLTVDKYHDVLVIQISTLGMDRLREWLVDILKEKLKPRVIFEKSLQPSRKEEGLEPIQQVLLGTDIDDVLIKENGLNFLVSLRDSQKTGFFLDHREMRQWVRHLVKGKRVLNCFSYTGGFTIYALAGLAKHVDSVDISAQAINYLKKNIHHNAFSEEKAPCFTMDVFEFLRNNPLSYDFIILDPPAFAKRKKDIISACRGYKDINRIAMQKMPKGSFLLTSSCSYYVDDVLFQKVIFQAAREADRTVRIIGRHRLAPDHPINICHPEGDYLKSLLLYVE